MKGFSLVELSIVLVILGLLTGGILSGQSLIRASELRSVAVDISRYATAVQSFRDKYMGLPGDFNKAVQFWGPAATCPGDHSSPSTSQATCDGTGNGVISSIVVGDYNERYRFWQHLANAGLIEGTYTGVAASASVHHVVAGTNVPAMRLKNTAIGVVDQGDGSPTFFYKNLIGPHQFHIMAANSTSATGAYGMLSTEEAWNIDSKIDDGRPGMGKVRSKKPASTSTPYCSTNDDPAIAEYALTVTGIQCNLIVDAGF